MSVNVTPNIGQVALDYVRRGWNVFALQPRSKKPLLRWERWQQERVTPDQVEEMWRRAPRANLAVVAGAVSGLVVLDVDGEAGLASIRGRQMPPTPTVRTGRGFHYYFQHPGGSVRNFTRRLPGLDLRAEGGYVVAPPSLHPSGHRYEWMDGLSPDEVRLAAIPEWLLELISAEATITEGRRNTTLASVAGALRRRGLGAAELTAELLQANQDRCVPPLPEEEVRTIAQSISRYSPAVDSDSVHGDYGHARLLAEAFAGRFRYAVHRSRWMEYRRGCWTPVADEYVERVASETARERYVAELAEARGRGEVNRLTEAIRQMCSHPRVVAALQFLRGWNGITTEAREWDREPYLLNVANGTLDLRTMQLRPHDHRDLLTKQAGVSYDPQARGEAWEKHLELFLPDAAVRRQVQRSLGLSMWGAVLEENLDIWYGSSGANGKTTSARVLMDVLGDYARRAAPNLLIASRHERHPTEIADLAGSRLVFSVEVDEGRRLAEALVKDLTGGDRKKARFMRGDFFEFEQAFSLVLIVNHRPTITGTDEAIWRRIRLIPWEVHLPRNQRRPQEEVVSELILESSGILNWLLKGLRDWQENRHWAAPAVLAATQQYRQEEDRLGGFLADCCEPGRHYTVGVGALYEAYSQWCGDAGEEPLSKRRLGELLKQRGVYQSRANKGRRWVGIRLTSGCVGDKR